MLLEKLGVTVGALTLGTAWVGGLVWVHGDTGPGSDATAVGQPTRVAVAPGAHGYGDSISDPAPTATPPPTARPSTASPRAAERAKARAARPAALAVPLGLPPLPLTDEVPFDSGEYPTPPASDTGLDTGSDTGSDTGLDTGLDTGSDTGPATGPAPTGTGKAADFAMATFNVLGSSHTEKGGHHSWLASGPQRVGGVLQILAQHDISVVGMQEFQRNQREAFAGKARGWQMYPTLSMPARDGENTVAWRTDTWDLVRPATVPIPYFNGKVRNMPYVLLQHKATGVRAYFSTFHNPADTRRYRGQQRFRNAATDREIALFNRIEAEGVPQLVTGDMNERGEYFCKVTARTALVAAAGGSTSGACRPPRPTMIDWIFGSPGVKFSNYRIDRSPLVRRTTDHPVVVTRARIAPRA